MTTLRGRKILFFAALAGAAAGFLLRLIQLRTAFDETGLPSGGSWIVLAAFCAVCVAALALTVRRLPEKTEYGACYGPDPVCVILYVAAAGLLLAANVSTLIAGMPEGTPLERYLIRLTDLLGILTALSFVATAAAQYRGEKPKPWTCLLPVVFFVLRLIFHFKSWSTDPVILDYCFKLFGEITVMLSVFYAGGFLFDKGKRRLAAFFCLAGMVFAGITLADGGLEHCLTAGSGLCLLAAHAAQILRLRAGEPE